MLPGQQVNVIQVNTAKDEKNIRGIPRFVDDYYII